MSEQKQDVQTYDADDPNNPNNLVVRGDDGDPLPRGTRMIEQESYERVVEGLKMSADACAHLARHEPLKASVWSEIGLMLDKMRREAVVLAGVEMLMKHEETKPVRGVPYSWRKARDRFLNGMQQATGGMRQLATCFRGDFSWSFLAQELERREKNFRALLADEQVRPMPKLILPEGFVRH